MNKNFMISASYDYGITDQLLDLNLNSFQSKFSSLQLSIGFFVR